MTQILQSAVSSLSCSVGDLFSSSPPSRLGRLAGVCSVSIESVDVVVARLCWGETGPLVLLEQYHFISAKKERKRERGWRAACMGCFWSVLRGKLYLFCLHARVKYCCGKCRRRAGVPGVVIGHTVGHIFTTSETEASGECVRAFACCKIDTH